MNLLSLFRPKPKQQAAVISIDNQFQSFGGSAWGNAVFRAAVDTIGRHAAKLTAHSDGAAIETLLTTSPNPYMSGYDLLYKLTTAYYTQNNGFVLIERDGANVTAFYPLNPSSVEFQQGTDGALYAQMRFADGRQVLFPYGDIIHLRRFFGGGELLGDNNAPLFPLLDTAEVLQQGISAATKNGVALRGVLKFTSLTNPEQIRLEKETFVRDFIAGNQGGIAATDMRYNFEPIATAPYTIPETQVNAVNAQIYRYLGVSEDIISGNYSEDAFSAFYESCIEPLAIQMSLEFSRKCGVAVKFTSERLEFSAAKTKISLLHEAGALGVLSVNEARKLLALPPVEDGDKRLQSLNYVDAKTANQYQMKGEVLENEHTDPDKGV
ncbi:MAG: phage portal protein [Oscillospiraceae bacterium]|jgi:HK97 family phage portal protein|nr:phage portal protein [Oscillospiraceae bacterium]